MDALDAPYGMTAPESALDRDCVISRRDLETLLHGRAREREKGYRNLAIALASASGLSSASTVTSHFGELLTAGLGPLEAVFLTLAMATAMASCALAVFFHRRVREAGTTEPWLLDDRPMQLGSAPEDPRRWP